MTGLTIRRFSGAIAVLGVVLIVGVAQTARATTYQWNGSSGTAWATPGNWIPNTASPAVGDIAQFASGSAYTNLPSLGAAASVDGLWQTGATAMTISGTGFLLTLTGTNTINGNANTGIEMDPGAGALSISSSVALAAAQQWLNNSGSLLTVSGAVNNAGFGLTIAGGSTAISSKISGAGGLTEAGNGLLTLTGVSTYTGSTTVGAGTLAMATGGTLGNSAGITINSGGLVKFSGATNKNAIGAANMPITVNSGGTLAVTVANAMGYNSQANYAQLTINGGLFSLSAAQYLDTLTMNGGTVAGASNVDFYYSTPTAITCTTTGLIAAPVLLDHSQAQTFSVSSGGSLTMAGVISGAGYTLIGGGVLNLTASNTYTAATKINGGVLNAGSLANGGVASAIGKSSNAASNLIIDGGTLQYTGASPASTDRLFTVGPSGQAALDASGGPVATMTVGISGGAIVLANSAAPTTLTLTGSGAGVLGAVLGDSGTGSNVTSLVKTGAGIWTLNGANTYTGSTSVSGGALYLNAANTTTSISVAGAATLGGSGSAPSAGANVANGGTLDFSQNAGNAFTLAGVTFAGSATINIDGLANYTSIPVLNAGALTTAGAIYIHANLGSAIVLSGTYDLVGYNSLGGAGTSAFTLASVNGLGNRQSASLIDNSNQIQIAVTGNTPYWSGNQPDWLTANAWTLQPANTPTTFQAGDADIFDDSANGSTYGGVVSLDAGNVAPASITFKNTSLAYTVSGSYGITGSASLTINGGGAVTIANSNGYTGGTTLTSGVLNLANSAAIGSGPLTLGGGVLDNTSGAPMTLAGNIPQNWTGSFIFQGSNPLNLGTGAVTMNASPTVTVNASTLTVGGPISGNGALTANGAGTLLLTASNTYSGGTILSNGTLQLGDGTPGHDGSLATTGITAASAAVVYDLAGSQTVSYPIAGSNGALIKSGTGVLTVIRANTYTGATTANSGMLIFGGGGSINNSSGITINNGGALQFSGGTNSNPIGNANMPITVNSGGTLAVTAGNSMGYSAQSNYADIALNGGYIGLSAVQYINTITMTGGTVGGTGALQFYYSVPAAITCTTTGTISSAVAFKNAAESISVSSGGTLNISGNISQAVGGWTEIDSGLLVLSGSNTYTGATSINGGTLQIGSGGTTGSLPSASVITNNSVLAFNRSDNYGGAVSNTIGGAGSLVVSAGTLALNGNSSYSGPTVVSGAVLNVATLANVYTPCAIGQGTGSPADLVIDGGTLQYTGASPASTDRLFTVGPSGQAALDASGGPGATMTVGISGGAIVLANSAGPATLTLTGSGAGALGAVLGDSGTGPNVTSLVKTGAGTWTLNGANTYTGPTTVSGGALYLNAANTTASISVAGAATLGGSGSAPSAAANVANGGTLDFSQNAGNAFALAGLTFAGSATINVDALANYTSSPVLSTGALTPSSTAGLIAVDANLGSATVLSGTYDVINYTGSIGGAGFSAFTISVNGLGNRQHAALVNASNQIDVVVSGTTPFWSGNQADWTAANAWTLQPGNTPGTFQAGDSDIFDDTATGSTYGGNVALNTGNVAPAIVTFNNSSLAYTVSGSFGITGSAALAVQGGGTVTIATSNGYTGGTSVANNSTLNANAPYALGAGTVSVVGGQLNDGAANSLGSGLLVISGGVVNVANPQSIASVTLGGALLNLSGTAATLGSGTLAVGGGTMDNTSGSPLTLAGNNPQFWAGSFIFQGSNPLNLGTGAVTMNASPTVTVNASTLTVGGPISGNGALTANGAGTLLLTASNTYSGGTILSNGTLQLGDGATGHDGSLATSGITAASAAVVYDLAGSQTVGYPITGSNGALIKSGTGVLTVTSANTYTGTTTANGGTLIFGAGGSINNSSGIIINNGGAVQFSGGTNSNPIGAANMPITVNSGGTLAVTTQNSMGYTNQSNYANIALNGGNVSLSAIQYINSITLTGGTVGGTGTLQFWYSVPAAITCTTTGTISSLVGFRNAAESISVSSGGTLTISGDLSQAVGGWTEIDSGLLVLSASNTYTGATTISGGTLQLGTGQSGQDGSIDTTSGVTANTGAELVFNLAGSDTATYSIVGSGALAEVGSGTLILSGTNTYSGGTTVNGGTLIATNSQAIADGTSLTVGNASAFPASVVPAPAAATAVSPVPEPGTLALLALAAMVGLAFRRKRRG